MQWIAKVRPLDILAFCLWKEDSAWQSEKSVCLHSDFEINEMNFRFLMHTIIFWLSTQLNFVVQMYKSGFVRFYSTQLRCAHAVHGPMRIVGRKFGLRFHSWGNPLLLIFRMKHVLCFSDRSANRPLPCRQKYL